MAVLKLLRPQNLDRLYMLKRVLVMRIPEEEYFRLMAQHRPREVTGVLEIDRLQPGELLICSLVTGPSCVMQIQEGEAGGYAISTGAMDPALSELLREGQQSFPVLGPVSKGVLRGDEVVPRSRIPRASRGPDSFTRRQAREAVRAYKEKKNRPRWKQWGNILSKLWTREV